MIFATISYTEDEFASLENSYTDDTDRLIVPLIIVWVFTVPTALLLFLDFNLVAFHLYLIKKKMTTFNYIIYTSEKAEKAEELVKH